MTLFAALACPAVAEPTPQVLSARYAEPTRRYDHGVLGDGVEWGALMIGTRDSAGHRETVTFRLPRDRVFEDIAPRLADLDGDGSPEVIVVETQLSQGAQLAIYDAAGKRNATPHIGAPYRWLAPVGAADLDGDGRVEIAYVDRPHLAKTLRIWRYLPGEERLVELISVTGFTNHRIGWDHIAGGLRDCGKGPEMILADGDWTRALAVRLSAGGAEVRGLGPYSAARMQEAMACR